MKNPITELRQFANRLERFFDDYAKLYDVEGLGGPQGHVILYLTKHTGEDITIKVIEDELKISKSVTSNLIKRMEKNGFIKVMASQQDKRSKLLYLTEHGRAKAGKYEKFIDAVHVQMFKDIEMEHMRQAFKVFEQLRRNISENCSAVGSSDDNVQKTQEEVTDA
ncbi:MarR family winged helix-turn-helix transcriptional regulator [Streptococcus merionis]|uniref:MarR family winged helix-turn-helix transcriptional regulator n=1 Tax=Streptococcus merionis TaxID=400065 RepID=UPI003511E9E2